MTGLKEMRITPESLIEAVQNWVDGEFGEGNTPAVRAVEEDGDAWVITFGDEDDK